MKELQREINEWQVALFGPNEGRSRPILRHLILEVKELDIALHLSGHKGTGIVAHEAADIFLLLSGLCSSLGIDLEDAVRAKLEINKTREWKEPDEHGVIEHKD